jgi:hypothetical protein
MKREINGLDVSERALLHSINRINPCRLIKNEKTTWWWDIFVSLFWVLSHFFCDVSST